MHRYEELEKSYYKYKLKKVFLIFIIITLLIGIGFVLYYSLYSKSDKKGLFLKKDNISLNETKKNKIYALEFNNSFSKNLKKHKEKNKTNVLILSFNIPKLEKEFKKEDFEMKNDKKDNLQQKTSKINYKIEKNNNKFLIKKEKVNVNQLIKNFSLSPSFEIAIQIAKLYFEKNDLKNSQQWALKANSIDPYRYESWELFALILIKKGKNKKAKEILNIYLNDYGYNEKVEKLLRSLE